MVGGSIVIVLGIVHHCHHMNFKESHGREAGFHPNPAPSGEGGSSPRPLGKDAGKRHPLRAQAQHRAASQARGCFIFRGLIATAALALSSCGGLKQPTPLLNYQPELFGASAFTRHFPTEPTRTCEAARRALLSQGYVVTEATASQVTARKYFQPDVVHHVQLEFKVVCAPEAGNGAASVAFVSGLNEQYVMRKVKDSASVGVGGIGSLSLPVEGGLDALVKVSSETVVNPELYERFFALIHEHLNHATEPPSASTSPTRTPSAPMLAPPASEVEPAPAAPTPAASNPAGAEMESP
jgi:hypothetical protein